MESEARGGILIGEDGASHQCIEDISLMRTIPGMTVLAPCDEFSIFEVVKAALELNGPVYLRFGRTSAPPVYTEDAVSFIIGKGNVIRDGSDVTILAIGGLGSAVAEVLAEHGGAILRRIGVQDCFGCSGKPSDLKEEYGLNATTITQAAIKICTSASLPTVIQSFAEGST